MIKSENWKRLSMRKRPELSAKLVFKDLHGEIETAMMLDESVTSLCLPFLPPVLAYIDLTIEPPSLNEGGSSLISMTSGDSMV